MMKFLPRSILMTVALALALTLGAGSVAAQTLRVGVIDLRKVFESYYKKVQTDESFKVEAENLDKERKDMIADAQKANDQYKKLVDSANDMAVSKEERDKAKAAAEDKYRELASRKEALDQYDRESYARLQEEKRQKRDVLVAEIKDHLAAMAKAAGYNLVLDTSGESANMVPVALYANGLPDLTDALTKELNAGAPASFAPPSAEALKTNTPPGVETVKTNK